MLGRVLTCVGKNGVVLPVSCSPVVGGWLKLRRHRVIVPEILLMGVWSLTNNNNAITVMNRTSKMIKVRNLVIVEGVE